MSSRASMTDLFKLHGDIDRTVEDLENELDDTAIALLTSICAGLSLAAAGVRHGDAHRREHARQCAAEYILAICDVLEVWEMSDVEIIDGPALACDDDPSGFGELEAGPLGPWAHDGADRGDVDDAFDHSEHGHRTGLRDHLDDEGDDGDDDSGDDRDGADPGDDSVDPPDLAWLAARDWSSL